MKKHANTPTNEVNHFYCFRMITKSIVSPYHDWNPRSVIYNIHTWYLWSKIVPISFSSFSCIIVCRKRPSTPPPSPSHCMQTNDVCRSPLEIRRRSHLYILLYYTFFFYLRAFLFSIHTVIVFIIYAGNVTRVVAAIHADDGKALQNCTRLFHFIGETFL